MTTAVEERFWAKVDRSGDCWAWTGCRNRYGYGQFGRGDRSRRRVAAHRFAWELTQGPIPTGMHVLHLCDNPPCVNPAHLFLGTNAENVRDRDAKGRAATGVCHGRAVLTDEIVREARALASGGMSRNEIAARFGVAPTSMAYALKGRTWRHVA